MTTARAHLPHPGESLAALRFTLRTKGVSGFADRLRTVAARFGPTPKQMIQRLDELTRLTSGAGVLPTLPITATVLARNSASIVPFAEMGVEFAVHGLYHNDHASAAAETQLSDTRRAVDLFASCGLHPQGFRAPYLRANAGTSRAVKAAGLRYQSDDSVVFDIAAMGAFDLDGDAYLRALEMYGALDAASTGCRPSLADGLVRIPVCLPDDEMLVDRLHLDAEQCADIWMRLLDSTHQRRDLFTMQVHPERLSAAAEAIRAVLDRAAHQAEGVWAAQLGSVADWWIARSRSRLVAMPCPDGHVAVTVDGDARARLEIVSGGGLPRSRDGARRVVLPARPFPGVGVAPGAPPKLHAFLRDEGYLVTTDLPPRECAIHLGDGTAAARRAVDEPLVLRRSVEAATAPVVALARWPQGYRSALAVTGDVDALTIGDFVHRMRENGRRRPGAR